jgi:hypothetical protein
MTMEIGKTYYVISHAYFHYIGTVEKIISDRLVSLTNVVQVHSSSKSWTEFFKQGIDSKDRFDLMPNMPCCNVINALEWGHPLPKSWLKK